jgi:hypothetical protein
VVSQQATWQAWRVAFYLESRRWLNSVVRNLQNPIGLLTTILALLKTATFNIPTPTPLEKQNPHRVSLSAL